MCRFNASYDLKTCRDTRKLGGKLLELLPQGGVIFLYGELGAGKTTLVQGLLQSCGYQGIVKSPTYTLVEPYLLAGRNIYHFDLYRLGDPEEMEYLGVRELFGGNNLCLVEWPEKAAGFLPAADLHVYLSYNGSGREARLELGQQ